MSRAFRWTMGIVIGLLVLSCLLPQAVTLAFHLVAGWAPYLGRVTPDVRMNGAGLATAAVCLVAVVLLGHRFARWLWGSMGTGGPWRLRWTGSVVAIVVLMFVAGLGATGVAHQAAWLARSEQPMFTYRSRESANRVKCASNMKQIGLALLLYARDNGGRLPDSVSELLLHADVTPGVFCCPSSNDDTPPGDTPQRQIEHMRLGRHCSYVYHGRGLMVPLPADIPIACEPIANHDGEGMNILFGDGSVEFLSPAHAERALQRLPTTRPIQPGAGA